MQTKYIYISYNDEDFNKLINNIRDNGGDVTVQMSVGRNCSYGKCDGNYIITRPDNGNLFHFLEDYSGKHEEGTFSIEECKKEIRKELDNYLKGIRDNYPDFDKWISASSIYYVILIHLGGDLPEIEEYTNGLIDAWFSDKENLSKNYLFSMVSLDGAFPKEYWNDGNFVFLPEQKVLPSVITEKMKDLGIPIPSIPQESDPAAAAGPSGVNDHPLTEDEPGEEQKTKPSVEIKGKKDELGIPIPSISQESELPADAGSSGVNNHAPKEGTTGEDQIMKTPTPTNSFSFWTAVISIVFVGFFAFLSYVFPAIIRFVPDEGEYVTETEVITMPVALPEKKGNIFSIWVPVTINEKKDMKTKKRIVGLTRAKPETFKVIMDAKDNSPADPYHYRRITRKAAPIQYFHLSMIFFVYVLCCVFCFIIFLKLFRRYSRQEQIDREFEFKLAEKFINNLQQTDQYKIRKRFAEEALQVFFSKDEA